MVTLSKRKHRRNKLSRIFYVFMCFVLVIGLSAPTSAIGDSDSQNAATPTNQTTNASKNQPSTPAEVPVAKSTFKTSALQLYSDSALTDVLNAGDTVTSGQDIYGKFTYTFANAPQKNTWYTLTFDGNVDSVSAIGTSQITVNGQKAGEYRFDGTTVSFKYDSDWLGAHANGAGASGELDFKIALSDGAEAGGTVPVGISGVADDINLTEAVPEAQADETQAETTSVDANTLATENALPADQLMASAAASNDEADSGDAATSGDPDIAQNATKVTRDMLEAASSDLVLYKNAYMTEPFTNLDTIKDGDTIYGSLSYTFKNSNPPHKNTWYKFSLTTQHVSVPQPLNGTDHKPIIENGVQIGEWFIFNEGNGQSSICFKFDSKWLDSHSSNVSGVFNFEMKYDASDITPGPFVPITIDTIDKTIELVPSTPEPTQSFSSNKTATLNDDGTYTFDVTLGSSQPMSDISLDDTMPNALSFDTGSFRLVDADGHSVNGHPVGVTVDTPEGTTNTHASVSIAGELPAGDYTLTYTANLTDVGKKAAFESQSQNGLSYRNSAQWHVNGQNLDTRTADATVPTNPLSKSASPESGQTSTDEQTVDWTVNFAQTNNSHALDIFNGATLKDTIPAGLTLQQESFQLVSVDADGNETSQQLSVGSSEDNDVQTGTNEDGTTYWEYTPRINTTNGHTYYVKYSTKIDDPSIPQTYRNWVTESKDFNGTYAEKTYGTDYRQTLNVVDPNTGLRHAPLAKHVLDSPEEGSSNWGGEASWNVVSDMAPYNINDDTKIGEIRITDTLHPYKDYNAPANAGDAVDFSTSPTDLYFDQTSLQLTYKTAEGATVTLDPDADYKVAWSGKSEYPDKPTTMTITFIPTDNTRAALKSTITTTYRTESASQYTGYYQNNVSQKYYGSTSTIDAGFSYRPSDNAPVKMEKVASTSNPQPQANGTSNVDYSLYVNEADLGDNSDQHIPARHLSKQKLTVVDVLPAGVALRGTPTINLYDRAGHLIRNVALTNNDQYSFSSTTNADDTTTLTWIIDTESVERGSYSKSSNYPNEDLYAFKIDYGTTITPDGTNQEPTIDYTNNAHATFTSDPDKYELGRASATVTVQNHKVFKQSGRQTDGNELQYTIEANRAAAQLGSGDHLDIVDTLDSRMQYEPGTLVVENVADEHNPVTLESGDGANQYGFTMETIKDNQGADTTRMTVSIPNKMHVRITYKVRLSGQISTKQENVSNTVTMRGFDESGATVTNPSVTIYPLTASASGSSGSFEITKDDASHGDRLLPGAQFGLYRVDTSNWDSETSTLDPDDVTGTLVSVKTTNEQGVLTFSNEEINAQEDAASALQTSTLYYFQELAAPDNYSLDDAKHFFILKPADTNDTRANAANEAVYNEQLTQAQARLGENVAILAPTADHDFTTIHNRPMSQVSLQASKTFDDTTGATKTMTAGQFTFLVKDASGHQVYLDSKHRPTTDAHSTVTTMNDQGQSNSVSEDNTPLTATNTANGSITFPTMFFDTAGTQTFVLSEVQGNTPGVTYDTDTHTISFEVQEEGTRYSVNPDSVTVDGSALASSNVTTEDNLTTIASGIAFGNTYAATGTAEVSAHKVLDGADLSDGQFTFGLYRGDSAEGTPIETATNDADGNITFDALSYNLSSVGNQTYTIHEQVPAGATQNDDGTYTLNGVSFDANDHTVHVAVADNGDGTLSTTVTYDEGATAAPTFTNTYTATGSTTLTAKKVLNGANLTDGQFTFALYEGESATGEPIQTATNNANGDVAFNAITYELSDVGEHTYTMKEQVPNGATRNADGTYTLNNITYDANAHTAHVVVTDNGDGTVAAVVTYDGESATAPTFTNTYTEPAAAAAPAQNQLAKTSDTMIGLSILIVALVAGGVALAAHRQRKNGRRSQH